MRKTFTSLFRSIHTVKGSAAQVGLARLSAIAHRVEDLIGELRDGRLQPSAEIIDVCLESVDVLKRCLHRQWTSDAEMRSVVDPLLARIHELAPGGIGDGRYNRGTPLRLARARAHRVRPELVRAIRNVRLPLAQAKSVRISLDRLDRMMNAVGELVINRTRMVGRLSELGKLVEVLNFSKEPSVREGFRISRQARVQPHQPIAHRRCFAPQMDTFRPNFGAGSRCFPPSGPDEFSDLEMDRYDDFNILSRSLTEISADVTEVLTQLEGFMGRVDWISTNLPSLPTTCRTKLRLRAWCRSATFTPGFSRTARDASKATGKPIELNLEGADTELDNNIIQHISDPLIHLVRNAVAHGVETPFARREAGKSREGAHHRTRLPSRKPHLYRSGRRWPRHRLSEHQAEACRFRERRPRWLQKN